MPLDLSTKYRPLVGELGHGLNTNRQSNINLMGRDLVRNCRHSHETGRAKPVDCLDGNGVRDSSDESCSSCCIWGLLIEDGADTDIPKEGRVKVYSRQGLLLDCLRMAGHKN